MIFLWYHIWYHLWYHTSISYMISYTFSYKYLYDIIANYVWQSCQIFQVKLLSKSVKTIYFTVPKKNNMTFDFARTRTLLCTLQRNESYCCTIGTLTYELHCEVVLYTCNAQSIPGMLQVDASGSSALRQPSHSCCAVTKLYDITCNWVW